MLQLGLLLALQLPQGEYQPGQSRSLSPTLFSWMNVLLFGSAAGKASLLGHYGKLTYLGRVGGEDRYFMVTQMAASQRVRSIMRLGLHGELRFDAKRGVLTRYQLSGPMNGSFAMGPGGGRMAAEGHWETSFNSVAPQKAGQNQDQEAGRKK